MNKIAFFTTFAGLLVFVSCQNDSADGVQEIRTAPGANSELVRNPATANAPLDTTKLARIEYEESEFDFGAVKEGDIVTHVFKFKNVGKVPLTIAQARSSCGCTVPEYPKTAIAPGERGEIKATFNTESKVGPQRKYITINANTYPNETRVLLKGMVEVKK